MINNWLDYEEQTTLEAILRFHHADSDPDLLKHLAEFCNWIHATEKAKFDKTQQPPYLIALLSLMGIYGKDALAPRKEPTPT